MKQNSTLITIILDRSGSMGSVRDATITGFNEFLKGQQAVTGEAKMSLIQFDDAYEINFMAKEIGEVKPLTHETYQPRGGTALLDAIGRTIIETGKTLSEMKEEDRPTKVIVVIQTDGQDNQSREFNKIKISEMIKLQRDTYKWDFIFLGAGQDAIMSASTMGIGAAHAMSYNSTQKGSQAVYATMDSLVTRGRKGFSTEITKEERIANT